MRIVSLAMSIIVLSAVAAGCSSGDDADGQGDVPDGLTVGVAQIPETLDPGQNYIRQQYAVMQLVSGTLTEPDADGEDVRPGLAENLEEGDDSYTATLRSGLTFSDGTELTSEDVVASFEHYMGDDLNGYGYTFDPIQDVRATDEQTVVFNLRRPYPSLPFILALPSSAIVPSEVFEAKKPYEGDPLPTAGPYEISSFGSNEMTLEFNDSYWGEARQVQSLTFRKISDPAARLAQAQGGEIDFADGISPKQAPQISAPLEVRRTLAVNGITIIALNNRENSLLSDVRIRQAIGLALDRNEINEIAYAGQNEPALGLWSDGWSWNDPFLPEAPDLEAATESLQGTACEDGCELEMEQRTDDETLGDIAIPVQQELKEIGIDVRIEKVDSATSAERAAEGDYDMRASFSYDVGEFPDGYLAFTLGPTIEAFYTGYNSEKMNALIDEVSATGGEEQAAVVAELNALFAKDLPLVPIEQIVVVSAGRVPAEAFNVDPTFYYHVG